MSEFHKKQNVLTIALPLVGLAITIAVGAFVAHYNQQRVTESIQKHLDAQVAILWDLAVVTDRNGADEVVSRIIADCPRRGEYETLLNDLGILSKKELITVQNLYESCGSFFAERKALMVTKLERELHIAHEYAEILSIVNKKSVSSYKLDTWKEVVAKEETRSALLSDQTAIQSKIIALLISGATTSSKDVRALVQDAQDIGELLNVQDHEIDTLRGKIQS